MAAAGWQNPDAPYDFTQAMWNDYNTNYAHLSWEEYMQMTKWGIKEIVEKTPNKPKEANKQMKESNMEERMAQPQANQDSNNRAYPANKKYSFAESYAEQMEATDPVHYHFDIEPFDYIHDNQMGFAEGNVIKYITRWRYKDNGIEDLYKAKQYIDMLIAKELIDDTDER